MKKYKIIIKTVLTVYLFTAIFNTGNTNVYAVDFDPSFVLSNEDVNDYNSMALFEIQSFLVNINSFLASYITQDKNGIIKSASSIIYDSAQNNHINPKWIIVTLQKEQSLIADQQSPTQSRLDWAMGYAVCDDCNKTDPSIQRFRGFGKQVNSASAQMRYYMDNPNEYKFKAGEIAQIDDKIIFIKNTATASMYSYTPHIHGNENFYNIWARWFTTVYPDGSLVKVEGENVVWYIQNGLRRVIYSPAIQYSLFEDQKVLNISQIDLENFIKGEALKYANYSLVKDPNGDIYLLDGFKKKKIESMEVFRKLGFQEEQVLGITLVDINTYQEDRNITLNSVYPTGQLIQDVTTGGVFYVQDGFKYPIINREILNNQYKNRTIIKGDIETLNGFLTGQKIRFKDGTLIKVTNNPNVYVIANGTKRHIANASTFNTLGYSWNNIIETNEQGFNLHPNGEEINLNITIYEQ